MAGEQAPASAPAAPSAPAGAPAAPAQQQGGGRGRVSSFEQAMEAKNAAGQRRANAPQQPQTQQPQRQASDPAARAQRVAQEQQQTPEQPLLGGPDEDGLPPELEGEPPAEQAEDELLIEADPTKPEYEQQLAAAIEEFKATGSLPELFHKATIEFTDAFGNVRNETVAELTKGAMRLSDYHRGMGQLKQAQQQTAVRDQNVREHFQKINDPAYFLETYEDRGYGAVLDQVFDHMRQRKLEEKSLIEAAGYRVMQACANAGNPCAGNDPRVITAMQVAKQQIEDARAAKIENRRIKAENARIAAMQQQQVQQQSHQQNVQQLERSMSQLVPMALKATGIFDSEANRAMVLRNLGSYVGTLQNWDGQYTRAHILAAARITREELADMRNVRRAQPAPAKPQRRALPPGGPSRSGTAQPLGASRKRPSDMESDPKFAR